MIAYMTGGYLDGSAKTVGRKCRSVAFELKDGKTEWYRICGKKVFLKRRGKTDKKPIQARVFRYGNTTDPKYPMSNDDESLIDKIKGKVSSYFGKTA